MSKLPKFPYRISSDGTNNFKVEQLGIKTRGGRGRQTKEENIGQVYVVNTFYYPKIEQAVEKIRQLWIASEIKDKDVDNIFEEYKKILEEANVFIKRFAKAYYNQVKKNGNA